MGNLIKYDNEIGPRVAFGVPPEQAGLVPKQPTLAKSKGVISGKIALILDCIIFSGGENDVTQRVHDAGA